MGVAKGTTDRWLLTTVLIADSGSALAVVIPDE
jgi:hypothetical protein